jgi:hypothetical protein
MRRKTIRNCSGIKIIRGQFQSGIFSLPSFASTAIPWALMESKWSEARGQYFLWEPVDNYIPEMEFLEHPSPGLKPQTQDQELLPSLPVA